MAKTFAYRDGHGTIYPPHPAMLAQPGLVPGQYDTETKTFTPTGNPQQQTGSIITDAGFGGHQKVLSGLGEDKGANTAPLRAGVAFTLPADHADAGARAVELEQQLAEEQERSRALAAQIEMLSIQTSQAASTVEPDANASEKQDEATSNDAAANTSASTGSKRVRKTS
ncbi:hypothetical protein AWB76_03282 [Caballeronia temeraria]|uniref:Uncharacterized protein n=1 Tax=Caballeronia temeraria TaxID=1777137 RepID=A0A158AY39_9BURK|nr:hypothetical protein [Caballeronia temeraria]SAK62629.1 hypothetical protein AWB76_03282 [Caballeronia temeraria]